MLFITCLISGQIGFYVGYSSSMFSGSTIQFDVIQTNLGNGWSSSNHRFTAPVKGLYYFTLNIMTPWSPSQHYAAAHIMRGNVNIHRVVVNRSSRIHGHIPASASAAVMLNAGEQVWAKRYIGYLFSGSNLNTHFVGFLIQKVN